MKDRFEKLSQFAVQSAHSASRGLLDVQNKAQDISKDALNKATAATSIALAAGKSVQHSMTKVIAHETTQAVLAQVKETSLHLADSATHGAKVVGTHVVDSVKKLDDKLEENHVEIKEKAETVSMSLGIAAGVAAGAAIIGPPIVVAAAPIIGAAATVTGAVAGSAYFYSKWKTKQAQSQVENKDTPASDLTNETTDKS